MTFTLSKALLIASSLLITNVNCSDFATTPLGGLLGSNNGDTQSVLNNTSTLNYDSGTQIANNEVNNNIAIVDTNNNQKKITIEFSKTLTETEALGEIKSSCTGTKFSSIKTNKGEDRSYTRFYNDASLLYITELLAYYQNDSESVLNENPVKIKDINKCKESISNIECDNIMRFSLIFQTMLENNLKEQSHQAMRIYDRFEMYRIFSNINENIKEKIDNTSYRILPTDNFLQMIVAQFFELAIGQKFKEGKTPIVFPIMNQLLTKVKDINELKEKMEFIKNNSGILNYNIDTLIQIINNNKKLTDMNKKEEINYINNIYSQKDEKANESIVDEWNEVIDYINNGKESINAVYGTDEYWKEYREKNPLMKTLIQSVILFNKIFNDNNN